MPEMTDEAVKALLDCLRSDVAVVSRTEAADMIEALHAQLADAKAAQAMVLKKAVRGVSDLTHWTGDDDHGTTLVALQEAITAIRALADTDGLALVQALRAERDDALNRISKLQSRLLSDSEKVMEWSADRDRLAAANAALEAEIAITDKLMKAEAEAYLELHADRDRLAAANAALEAKIQALEWFSEVTTEAAQAAYARVVTLAEVQADARREGGE